MARDRMIELVSVNICVSKDEARAALEARNWDVLEAARLLQQQARAKQVIAEKAAPRRRFFGISVN